MQKRNSIISVPMLIGIVLSLALHGAALYSKGIRMHTSPMPLMEQGRTVVQLTLVPSIASQAAMPEPQIKESVEQPEDIAVPIPVETKSSATAPSEFRSVDSVEQNASLEKDKGVISEVSLIGAFRPSYPRVSQRRGETGTVTLSVHVLADGTVDEISIEQSAGYRRLDEAALKAARKCAFTPSVRDSRADLSYTFTLTDD